MAKIWIPAQGEAVGQKEVIGRRLFDLKELRGAHDQLRPKDLLEYSHFEETRGNDVSVDRLGRTGTETKVCHLLQSKASLAASRRKLAFDGWAVIQAAELLVSRHGIQLALHPSPTIKENGVESSENPYHAHISDTSVRDNGVMENGRKGYVLALHLRELFSQYGKIKTASAGKSQWHRLLEKAPWLKSLRKWLLETKQAIKSYWENGK